MSEQMQQLIEERCRILQQQILEKDEVLRQKDAALRQKRAALKKFELEKAELIRLLQRHGIDVPSFS